MHYSSVWKIKSLLEIFPVHGFLQTNLIYHEDMKDVFIQKYILPFHIPCRHANQRTVKSESDTAIHGAATQPRTQERGSLVCPDRLGLAAHLVSWGRGRAEVGVVDPRVLGVGMLPGDGWVAAGLCPYMEVVISKQLRLNRIKGNWIYSSLSGYEWFEVRNNKWTRILNFLKSLLPCCDTTYCHYINSIQSLSHFNPYLE